MMENAGCCLAILAWERFLEGKVVNQRIAVLVGMGGQRAAGAKRGAEFGLIGSQSFCGGDVVQDK